MDQVFHPFRAIRYRPAALGTGAGGRGALDLSPLITPPYDIISPDLQQRLHEAHPHNFIRIELARQGEGRYAEAARTLSRWLADGVLGRDARPALYLLEQSFRLGEETWTRRGVLGLVRLPEGEAGYVLSHEGTLAAARQDRLRLMRACQAMTSPILALVADPRSELLELLAASEGEPAAIAQEPWPGPAPAGPTTHRLRVVEDEAAQAALRRAIGPGPIYIADGHHRFETALTYRAEMRQAHPDAPDTAGINYALMLIVSARDQALKILPTHRLLVGLGPGGVEALKRRIRDCCEVHEWPLPDPAGLGSQPWLEGASPDRHVFGAYCGDGRYYVLVVRDQVLPRASGVVDSLDVTILHDHLLAPVLANHPDEVRLTYVVSEEEALEAVARGEAEFAFFLRPTRVGDVLAAAQAGERMPGKSTYFHPKVPAGLLLSDASPEPI